MVNHSSNQHQIYILKQTFIISSVNLILAEIKSRVGHETSSNTSNFWKKFMF